MAFKINEINLSTPLTRWLEASCNLEAILVFSGSSLNLFCSLNILQATPTRKLCNFLSGKCHINHPRRYQIPRGSVELDIQIPISSKYQTYLYLKTSRSAPTGKYQVQIYSDNVEITIVV